MTVPFGEVHLNVFMVLDLISDILDGKGQFMICKFIQEHSQFPQVDLVNL